MHQNQARHALALVIFGTCTACATAPRADDLTLATLYGQTSAENAAVALSVYQAAGARLSDLVGDLDHSAALEQGAGAESKRPAIILDVDETVLDNSPFEVRQILDGTSYPTGWDEWCNQASATAIPGALELTRRAHEMGVRVFYVTNRKAHLEEGTRENLVRVGFPVDTDVDVVLMRGERPEWTGDKTTRRAHVAADHRIVMLFGDNTGDFLSLAEAKAAISVRMDAIERQAARWGQSWFMLPNAMYGNWDGAALDYDFDRSRGEIHDLRVKALDPQR